MARIDYRVAKQTDAGTLTWPVPSRDGHSCLQEAGGGVSPGSLVILAVGLGGEAGDDVLHAQPVPAQHGV